MRFAIIGLMILVLLSGCRAALFESLTCPDVVEYSAKTQSMLHGELYEASGKPKPGLETTREFIKDYGVMRDQARACRG